MAGWGGEVSPLSVEKTKNGSAAVSFHVLPF